MLIDCLQIFLPAERKEQFYDDSCVTEEVRNGLDGLLPARFPLCIRSQSAHHPLTVGSRTGKMCLRSHGDVNSSFYKDCHTNIYTIRGHVC